MKKNDDSSDYKSKDPPQEYLGNRPSTPPRKHKNVGIEEETTTTPTTAPSSSRLTSNDVPSNNKSSDKGGWDRNKDRLVPQSSKKNPVRHPIPFGSRSLTSSTRSVASNAYSAIDNIDENLEGLVIHEEENEGDDDEDITIASEIKSRGKHSRKLSGDEETKPRSIEYQSTTPVRFVAESSYITFANPPQPQPSTPKQSSRPSGSTGSNSRRSRNSFPSPREDSISAVVASDVRKAVSELKDHVDRRFADMREQNRRDFDRVLTTLQHESLKRSALDGRLHQQLLLQSETMVAMEIKLLRLEAKVERREAAQRSRVAGRVPSLGSLNEHSTGGVGGILAAHGSGSDLRANNNNIVGAPAAGGTILIGTTNTIDEEDDLEKMEIQVTRNSHNHRRSGVGSSSRGPHGVLPTAVVSSGASLASGVTATSFLDGVEEDTHVDNDTIDNPDVRSEDGDVEDEGDGGADGHDGSASTPTHGPGRHFTGLESILMNPLYSSTANEPGMSTRAVRGDMDCNSSLATSVTSATLTSTIVTATTRGGDSINIRSTSHLSHHDDEEEEGVQMDMTANSPRGRNERLVDTAMLSSRPLAESGQSRSRSQSPLTVQSAAATSIDPQSVASASLAGSILTTAAVAPARSFRARRDAAARMGNQVGITTEHNRPLANRIVSFTSNEVFTPPPEINEATDSITMPDELDNLSDVADVFADRARSWREEYESRLDAISKRFGTDG